MGDALYSRSPICQNPRVALMKTTNIVAFDLDGTLVYRESITAFLLTQLPLKQRLKGILLALPQLILGVLLREGNARLKERLLSGFIKGMSVQQYQALGHHYGTHIIPQYFDHDRLALLQQHLAAGDEVWLVSASLEVYVAPLAKTLGLSGACATRVESDAHGRLTGCFEGHYCWGPEKVARLAQVTSWNDRHLIAYGDSKGDAELLAAAAKGQLLKKARKSRRRH